MARMTIDDKVKVLNRIRKNQNKRLDALDEVRYPTKDTYRKYNKIMGKADKVDDKKVRLQWDKRLQQIHTPKGQKLPEKYYSKNNPKQVPNHWKY